MRITYFYSQIDSLLIIINAVKVYHDLFSFSTTISILLSLFVLLFLLFVSELQLNLHTISIFIAAIAKKKACPIFNKLAINMKEQILAKKALV